MNAYTNVDIIFYEYECDVIQVLMKWIPTVLIFCKKKILKFEKISEP